MNNDTEKEVIHEIDMCLPKYCYLKTLYGKTSKKIRSAHAYNFIHNSN